MTWRKKWRMQIYHKIWCYRRVTYKDWPSQKLYFLGVLISIVTGQHSLLITQCIINSKGYPVHQVFPNEYFPIDFLKLNKVLIYKTRWRQSNFSGTLSCPPFSLHEMVVYTRNQLNTEHIVHNIQGKILLSHGLWTGLNSIMIHEAPYNSIMNLFRGGYLTLSWVRMCGPEVSTTTL